MILLELHSDTRPHKEIGFSFLKNKYFFAEFRQTSPFMLFHKAL
jgi:hypothetical protein